MAGDILTRHAVRLGLRQVEGLAQADGQCVAERRGAGYGSVRDLWLRTGLAPAVLERLADADAFRSCAACRSPGARRRRPWTLKRLRCAGARPPRGWPTPCRKSPLIQDGRRDPGRRASGVWPLPCRRPP